MSDFRLDASQIRRLFASFVRMGALSAVNATSSTTITTPLTTVLSSAGDFGVSVPVQPTVYNSTTFTPGVITTGANNRCEIYDSTSKQKIIDANGNELYARITQSGGAYTLSYFSLVTGTETAYTWTATTTIDVELPYNFDLYTFPYDGLIGIKERNISDDPAASGTGKPFAERLTIATDNTVPSLTKVPVGSAGAVMFLVNGQSFIDDSGSPFAVNYTSKAVTYSATNAAFTLKAGWIVYARYFSYQ